MLSLLVTSLLAAFGLGASVRFGQGVSDIVGSIGGTTYARNGSGAYMRNRTHPINPQTPAQTLVRSIFGALSTGWRSITSGQRTTWIDAAQGPLGQRTNRLGEVIQLTGQQLYVSLNQIRQLFGLASLPAAPSSPTVMAQVSSVTLDVSGLALTSTIVTVDLTPAFSVAASDVLVYASPPLPPGRSRSKSATYRLIGTYAAAATAVAIDLMADYTAAHGSPTVADGDVVWFRVVPAVSESGVVGATVTAQAVIALA